MKINQFIMREKKYKLCLRLVAIILCLLFCGCGNSVISEDRVQDGLPLLDPADGMAKDIKIELYYRLAGEAYLVPVSRNISVRANEREERAIVRTLIEGVPQQPVSTDVSALFPTGTSIVEVSLDSGILYITLSDGFLDESAVESVRQEKSTLGEEYEAALDRAEQELYLTRRLGVYSLVNTITGYMDNIRVQILVDTEGTGKGERLSNGMLGLDGRGEGASDLMEPLGFVGDVVASAESIVSCMLTRMQGGEYERAYSLFMEAEVDGAQKPSYDDFEAKLLELGAVTGFEVVSSLQEDDVTTVVTVNLDFTSAQGEPVHINQATVFLKKEGDIYKTVYGPFMRILEEA